MVDFTTKSVLRLWETGGRVGGVYFERNTRRSQASGRTLVDDRIRLAFELAAIGGRNVAVITGGEVTPLNGIPQKLAAWPPELARLRLPKESNGTELVKSFETPAGIVY